MIALSPQLAVIGVLAFLDDSVFRSHSADLMVKAAPVLGVIVSILTVVSFDLEAKDVAVVGSIPAGLPALSLALIHLCHW